MMPILQSGATKGDVAGKGTESGESTPVPERRFLPICLNIENRMILVVGGGNAAMHKLRTLTKFTRNITVVAKQIDRRVCAYGLRCLRKSYDSADLDGVGLVYACTDDPDTNRRIYADSSARGILVNTCDNPGLSNFVSPAIAESEGLIVAVSSDAKDVRGAIRLRNYMRDHLDHRDE